MKNRIKSLRAKTGLSQVNFANMLGVSVATLRRWESGDAVPSPMAMDRIQHFEALTDKELSEACGKIHIEKLRLHENQDYRVSFIANGEVHDAVWMPYVINGPKDQVDFYNKLLVMQTETIPAMEKKLYFKRLSLLKSVEDIDTAQYLMETPKADAKSWSSDYGTHGFHRYVGRFPSHLIRAIINHFGATSDDTILDPFCGSGTTLVEARMLGIPATGIEISPLSAMMSRVKSQFPQEGIDTISIITQLECFYDATLNIFLKQRTINDVSYDEILTRPGNSISRFPNIEKWFTKEALLGTSIVVEYIQGLSGYLKDFLTIALSAKMRSIGNVDVDVVRAEYRKTPRTDVNVLKLVKGQIQKMGRAIHSTIVSSEELISSDDNIHVILDSVLNVSSIADNSISFIITSPPYGVESLSYLRTHLLSFRVLEPILGVDPYNFGNGIIGSEYLDEESPDTSTFSVGAVSKTYTHFFSHLLKNKNTTLEEKRIRMMMKFFEDMYNVISKFSKWVKKDGKVAFIIGNKKIGEWIIPTDSIIEDIFEYFGFSCNSSIRHKLKTNNSNSQVPWQERVIENEFVMLFKKER